MDAAAYTSDITAYGSYTADLTDIAFDVNLEQVINQPYAPQIKVDLNVNPGKLRLLDVNGRHVGKLRVTVFYANPRGQYLGDVWKKVDLNLREETYRLYLLSGIPFSKMVPAEVPKQILKIVMYDVQSDRIGSRVVKIK